MKHVSMKKVKSNGSGGHFAVLDSRNPVIDLANEPCRTSVTRIPQATAVAVDCMGWATRKVVAVATDGNLPANPAQQQDRGEHKPVRFGLWFTGVAVGPSIESAGAAGNAGHVRSVTGHPSSIGSFSRGAHLRTALVRPVNGGVNLIQRRLDISDPASGAGDTGPQQ